MNESLIWEKIGRLEQVSQSNSEDKSTLSELLTLYLQVDNRWKAFNQIAEQVKQRYPNDMPLLFLLIKGYTAQDKTDDQKAAENHFLTLSPVTAEDYQAVVQYYQETKHDQEKALRYLQQAQVNNITDPSLWMRHLSLLIEMKEFQAVLELLTPAKLKELQNPELNFIRAKLLMNTQPASIAIGEEAEYLLLEALKKDVTKVDAYLLLLEIYTSLLGDHDKVVFLIKMASTNGLENLHFYKECLTSLLYLNEICEAEELYEILEEYFPESEKLILMLVKVLHLKMVNLGSAKHIWAEYRKRKSIYQSTLYLSCIAVGESVWNELKSMGERQQGEGGWLIMDEVTQSDVLDIIRQVILYAYDMLLLLDPDNPEFPFLKGLFLAGAETETAKHSYQQALAIYPGFTYARYELGELYLQEGNWLEAYDHFKAVLNTPVYDVALFTEVYMRLSEISIRFGWIEEAENYLDIAQSISPKDNRVHVSLGKIYLKESKIIGSEIALDKAEEHLRTATELNPENCEAIYFLGQVYYAKSQFLPAIKQYLLAIEKGLLTERGEPFATISNCYLWISRSYYRLYKDMLFSSRDYLTEAIEYIRKIPVKDAEHPLLLEYMIELYLTAGRKEEADATALTLKKKQVRWKPIPEIPNGIPPGMIKILTVFSPSITFEESEEKAIFSKGNLGQIEIIAEPGPAELIITGNIGESFRNSISVAYGFVKYFLQPYYPAPLSEKVRIHVDIPGWFPKYDGPSAGVGIAIAMISAWLKQPIPPSFTMTGEITLMGHVLPVGGIKEKIEATLEKNISRVYIPTDNRGDYLDMILKGLDDSLEYPEIVPVSTVEEIVRQIFTLPEKK